MAERLTETLIKALKPPTRGERFIWDSELTGFAIKMFAPTRAHPEGARTFVLSYWLNGTERRYRIGAWPDWSVMAARAEAKEIRQRIDRGEDPPASGASGARRRPCSTWPSATSPSTCRAKSEQSQHDDGVMLGHILRHIGADRRVADVHHGDIVALHRAITDSGHPVLANRTVSCASRMFSLALKPMAGEDKPWRDHAQGNPCKGIERNPEAGQGALPEPGRDRGGGRGARRLRPHGGGRLHSPDPADWLPPWRGDARHLGAVRCPARLLDQAVIHTKQRKEHRLPLSAPALQLIADIRTRRGDINPDDYVFPGQRPGQPLRQLRTCWDAVCKHAGLTDVRIYDLRHTFAATGAGGGLSLPLIGRLLGHTQHRTTQRYAHLADDPLREAADKIASAITKAGKGGKVVRLRGGG